MHPPVGVRSWSKRHQVWLNNLHFEHEPNQVVLEDYRAVVRAAEERVSRLEAALRNCATSSAQVRDRRVAGFSRDRLSHRGHHHGRGWRSAPFRQCPPRQFMAYAGLVPSEHSSGGSRPRGTSPRRATARCDTPSARPPTMPVMLPPFRAPSNSARRESPQASSTSPGVRRSGFTAATATSGPDRAAEGADRRRPRARRLRVGPRPAARRGSRSMILGVTGADHGRGRRSCRESSTAPMRSHSRR
jgi:Transposase IS116/IS110/IS902 family